MTVNKEIDNEITSVTNLKSIIIKEVIIKRLGNKDEVVVKIPFDCKVDIGNGERYVYELVSKDDKEVFKKMHDGIVTYIRKETNTGKHTISVVGVYGVGLKTDKEYIYVKVIRVEKMADNIAYHPKFKEMSNGWRYLSYDKYGKLSIL